MDKRKRKPRRFAVWHQTRARFKKGLPPVDITPDFGPMVKSMTLPVLESIAKPLGKLMNHVFLLGKNGKAKTFKGALRLSMDWLLKQAQRQAKKKMAQKR